MFGQIGNSDGRQITNGSNIGFIRGDHLPDSFLKSGNKTIKYKHINGTPYINNKQELKYDIPIGKLFTSRNEYVNTFFMRYNAFNDNIELSLIDDGINYYLLEKKPNSWYLTLGANKYRAYQYILKKEMTVGFFVILSESDTLNYSLLKKEKVIFKDETKEKSSFVSYTPAEFKKGKSAYYLKVEEKLSKVPRKQKDFLKLFHQKKEELKAFIKKNKYSIPDESDLIAIISYYNTIIVDN